MAFKAILTQGVVYFRSISGNLPVEPGFSLLLGGNTADAAATTRRFVKKITGLSDATDTAALTVTIPNATHAAQINVKAIGTLGAGGAVGANESCAGGEWQFMVTRTAGVAAVRGGSGAYGNSGSIASGSAATCAIAISADTMSGAASAVNTFVINAKVTRGSGSSTNHQVLLSVEVINSNASGITVA